MLDLPFPAAAKTGTTTDWRDNWTIGYTTERIVGVWVGNADNTPMLDVSGIDGAGPIWRDIMLAAHPVDPPGFTRPPNVTDVEICGPSGMLPTPACTRAPWTLRRRHGTDRARHPVPAHRRGHGHWAARPQTRRRPPPGSASTGCCRPSITTGW
ncbi:MAG: hypothetical protein R2851_04525 [Caldilineaceae bacterium]